MKKRSTLISVIAVICVIVFWIIAAVNTNADTVQNSFWALVPPVIAIVLALVTKEVYSSLFVGILTAALLYSGFRFEGTMTHMFGDGFIAVLADSYNVGILIFLVILGVIVQLMNRTGGSAAFGQWASEHIKTRAGAMFATMILGVVIFIDDYFNCLTVGSVMRPVTDKHKVSRAKLAYLIDATAAPVCIIAPVSSWAAAVAGFVEGENAMTLFIRTIPFNFYALLTIIMMIMLILFKIDYGPMRTHEFNAIYKNDIYTTPDRPYENAGDDSVTVAGGKILDLVLPIIVLIVCSIIGIIYTGGFFDGATFIDSFMDCDASLGLVLGSSFALFLIIIYYLIRRNITFTNIMQCFPEGFKQMVPAILILTFAWTLKAMTDSLGAKVFVEGLVAGSAQGLLAMLPVIVFLIAVGLSFATGTSWGTFGMLIPIVVPLFASSDPKMMVLCMSACMAGAVCGDHCSPISDTTIMSSAGAQCNHINHVSTQLPYALTCAAVSAICYIVAGVSKNALVSLIVGIAIMLLLCVILRKVLPAKDLTEEEA